MAKLLMGAPVAAALDAKTKEMAEACALNGSVPRLAVVRLGADGGDITYEKNLLKRAARCGVEVLPHALPVDATEDALIGLLGELRKNDAVHGILLFRPLPERFSDARVRAAIAPEKDVDGATDASLAGVFTGSGLGFAPCTAEAVMELLGFYEIPCAGKEAVVIGRSLTVGRPLSCLLLQKNATVTLCHSKTQNLAEAAKRADILISAAGQAGLVGKEYFKDGQIVIDVGMHATPDGLMGDVKTYEAEPAAAAVTPVPGGVGTVTTSILMRHTVLAALTAHQQRTSLC